LRLPRVIDAERTADTDDCADFGDFADAAVFSDATDTALVGCVAGTARTATASAH
jgi:hypothetical protein